MRTRFKNGRLPITDVEQTVLRFVWLNPGKSRAEIAEKLNLSKSMLSKAVQTFEQMQLVIEERSTPSEGGRGQPGGDGVNADITHGTAQASNG